MSPVRSGTAAQVEPCVELWTRVIAARDGADGVQMVRTRAREAFGRPVVRFAVVGSGPEGFALTVVNRPGVALLSRLCVSPAATSRGLGAALVDDAAQRSRERGFDRLTLDVRETNERAIALYARSGFVAVSDPWVYDDGDLLVTLSLSL